MKTYKDLLVSESRNGKGIFTNKDFIKDECVFEVTGKLITCDEDDDMDEETRSNTYRYDENLYISPKGKIGDFLNHSCNPNAKVLKKGKKLFIYAIKSIAKGREVLIDYSTIIARDDSWKMKCNCGSSICRKKISKFALLPKILQEKYRKQNIVPGYILEI